MRAARHVSNLELLPRFDRMLSRADSIVVTWLVKLAFQWLLLVFLLTSTVLLSIWLSPRWMPWLMWALLGSVGAVGGIQLMQFISNIRGLRTWSNKRTERVHKPKPDFSVTQSVARK